MLPPSSHAAVAKRAVHCRMRGRVVVRNEAREVRSGFGYVNVSHSRVPTSVVAEESDNESEHHRGGEGGLEAGCTNEAFSLVLGTLHQLYNQLNRSSYCLTLD